MRHETYLLFCYGMTGPSKYGFLIQSVSPLLSGLYVLTHELFFRKFF